MGLCPPRFKSLTETTALTTDPSARLYKKAAGQAAKLCHMGHVQTENRNGLVCRPN